MKSRKGGVFMKYIKLLVVNVDDFYSQILDEQNSSSKEALELVAQKYQGIGSIKCIYFGIDTNITVLS